MVGLFALLKRKEAGMREDRPITHVEFNRGRFTFERESGETIEYDIEPFVRAIVDLTVNEINRKNEKAQ